MTSNLKVSKRKYLHINENRMKQNIGKDWVNCPFTATYVDVCKG